MQPEDLANVLRGHIDANSNLELTEALLPDLSPLLNASGSSSLTIANAKVQVADQVLEGLIRAQVVVEGQASFLNVDSMPVTLYLAAAEPLPLCLKADLPPGWKISDSVTNLPPSMRPVASKSKMLTHQNGLLDELIYQKAYLLLTNYAVPAAHIEIGLNLSATVDAQSVLAEVLPLLGLNRVLTLQGAIQLPSSPEGLSSLALYFPAVDKSLTVGSIALSNLRCRIRTTSLEEIAVEETRIEVGGTIAIGQPDPSRLELWTSIYAGAETWYFTGQADDNSLSIRNGINALVDLAGGNTSDFRLPDSLQAVGNIHLQAFSAGLAPRQGAIEHVSLRVGSDATWSLLPGLASIGNLSVNCFVLFPLSPQFRHTAMTIAGTLSFGRGQNPIQIDIEAHKDNGFDVEGSLSAGQTLHITDVIAAALEVNADLPALDIDELYLQVTSSGDYTIRAVSPSVWPILPGTSAVEVGHLSLMVMHNSGSSPTTTPGAASAVSGVQVVIAGWLSISGVLIQLSVARTGSAAATSWSLSGKLQPDTTLSLSGIINDLLPQGIHLPDEIPDLEFSDISIVFTPGTGAFSLSGTYTTAWDLPFGVQGLSVSKLDFAINREPVASAAGTGTRDQQHTLTCSLTLHAEGPFTILDGLVFENLNFIFALDQAQHDWSLSGTVNGILFDHPFALGASLEKTSTVRTVKLQADASQGIDLDLGGGSKLAGNNLSIVISKALFPAAGTSSPTSTPAPAATMGNGVQLGSSSAYSWSVSATGSLTVADVDELTGSGTLSLWKQKESVGLVFQPKNTAASFSLPEPLPHWNIHLALEYLSFVRTAADNGQASWAIDTDIQVRFAGLPDKLVRILPGGAVDGHLKINRQEVTLSVSPLVSHQEIDVSMPGLGNLPATDLGMLAIEVPQVGLQLGKNLSLSVEFGIGIPAEMNAIFGANSDGSPKVHFFNTYQKADETTLTRFSLGLTGGTGLQIQILTSPLRAIQFTKDQQGNTQYTADLGEFGFLELTLPTFSYNKTSFQGSHASFKQGIDPKTGQPRPLKLPLTPLKLLLESCKLDNLARKLPAGLPLQEIQIYHKDEQTGAEMFNGAAFDELLKGLSDTPAFKDLNDLIGRLTGFPTSLGNLIAGGLQQLGSLLDKLPDSLKDYLDIKIPEEFSFELSFTDSGSLQCNVSAKPALQILYPAMGPLGPQLNGITLRGFSIGEVSSGALIIITVDMDLHLFPLLPLAAALLLPLDRLHILPKSQDLVTHLIVDNLFTVIITELVYPIVAPLFFDQLGLEYLGLEGLTFQTHWSFPDPAKNIGLSDLTKLFTALGTFFTTPNPLDPKALEPFALALTIGPNFIALPDYLGAKRLDFSAPQPINFTQNLASLLNALKTLSLNEIAQALPLQYRKGKLGGQNMVSFAPLTMEADWLITTPGEFRALTPAQLAQVNFTTDDLTLLPQVLPTGQVQNLTGQIAARQGELDTMRTQVQAHITDLGVQITTRQRLLNAQRVQAQSQAATLQAQIGSLQAQIQSVQAQANQLLQNISQLEAQLGTNPALAPMLTSQVTALQQLQVPLSVLQSSLATSIAAYQALQQQISATSADSTLAQLNAEQQAAQQQLAALSSDPVLSGLQAALQSVQKVSNSAQEQGVVLFLKGIWFDALIVSFGLIGTQAGFDTGMRVSGRIGNWLDLEVMGVVVIEPHTSPAFRLEGQSALTIMQRRVFEGDVQVDDQHFYLHGQLSLFPPSSPLQISSAGQVSIDNHRQFLFQETVNVSLENFTLASSTITITNSSLTMAGKWLESDASFKLTFTASDFTLNGSVVFQVTVQTQTPPVYLGGAKVVDSLSINGAAGATLWVTLGTQGFAADATGWFMWNNSRFNISLFHISAPPLDKEALRHLLEDQIGKQVSSIFTSVYSTVSDWVKLAVNGVVQLAAEFTPAVDGARKWTQDIWVSTNHWGADTWKNTASWPGEISIALRTTYNYNSDQVASVLKNSLGYDSNTINAALGAAGFSPDQIQHTLQNIFKIPTIPGIPTTPVVPTIPTIPGVPTIPTIPGTPTIPDTIHKITDPFEHFHFP